MLEKNHQQTLLGCARVEDERLKQQVALVPSDAEGAPPIGWYEAEQLCRGSELRDLLSNQMTHSGRFHWTATKPETSNPVWPLYAAPVAPAAAAPSVGRAALKRAMDLLDMKIGELLA